MNRLVYASAVVIFLLPCAAPAQETAQGKLTSHTAATVASAPEAPKQEYLIKFLAKEVENGRVINTREYMLHTRAGANASDSAQIKTGSRVPIATGSFGGNTSTSLVNTQFTYVDVGINLQCYRIQLFGDRVSMAVKAEISSYDQSVSTTQPVIRQNQWEGSVTMPIGKTETIFSSDDVVSKRTLQVDLQVTAVR